LLFSYGRFSISDFESWRVREAIYVLIRELEPIVAVRLIDRDVHDLIFCHKLVSDLNRQTILQVENASLADILELGASLADLSAFKSSFSPSFSPEHCERSLANLTFCPKLVLHLLN